MDTVGGILTSREIDCGRCSTTHQPSRYVEFARSARRCGGNFAGSLACRGNPYPAILTGGQTPSCPTERPRMSHDRTACVGICSKLRTLGQKPWSFLSARSPFSFKHSCKVYTRSSASSRGTRCNTVRYVATARQSVPPGGLTLTRHPWALTPHGTETLESAKAHLGPSAPFVES